MPVDSAMLPCSQGTGDPTPPAHTPPAVIPQAAGASLTAGSAPLTKRPVRPGHPTRRAPDSHGTGQPNPARADEALLADIAAAPEATPTVAPGSAPDVAAAGAEAPAPSKPKLTRKVRRGLALMRGLLLDAFDESAPPAGATTARWPKYLQDDFNSGMAWIEANEEKAR